MERILTLPSQFNFVDYGVYDFNKALAFFDWSINDGDVTIDLTKSRTANFTAMSLLLLYAWHLTVKGCHVDFITSGAEPTGASGVWTKLGAGAWRDLIYRPTENFRPTSAKPLLAIRDYEDSKRARLKVGDYTRKFNVEYKTLLEYVISELLSNTLEHGTRSFSTEGRSYRFPSLLQFAWYGKRDELQFIVADLGIGIKQHLERAYPRFDSHAAALQRSVQPQVSGTFGPAAMYQAKNNAGMGLYLSSSILQRLHADMHLVSGDGILHISPTDVTTGQLPSRWPGTLVHVVVRLGLDPALEYHRVMTELKEEARREIAARDKKHEEDTLEVNIYNFFGSYAENKAAAIQFRDSRVLPAIEAGQRIVFDFADVSIAPHSVLNALLATPVERLGMQAFKRLRFINVEAEIRETIDYILDENTRA